MTRTELYGSEWAEAVDSPCQDVGIKSRRITVGLIFNG